MAKNQSENPGDSKTPSLRPVADGLRAAVDQAAKAEVNSCGPVSVPSALENAVSAITANKERSGPAATCQQTLWFTFFFDGTGNNLAADEALRKHSNIAKLFRVHRKTDTSSGIFSIYIPGVGTYFREIGDNGGSALGLGCGAMGEKRLHFALDQFDRFLARPLALAKAPGNRIRQINIAVFGFSRGAALARAFVNLLMESRCDLRNGRWHLRLGRWSVRFRFMGLFDTVASVGMPLSTNTTGYIEAYQSDIAGMISKRLEDYPDTRPERLAMTNDVSSGADPAPGDAHGHDDWGGKLKIHETVEEVRHFIAAHEIRNSFPLDSISTFSNGVIAKPSHFWETVYPGAHSDVGGGYARGEGARGLVSTENLSVIPLRHMYDFAIKSGVPLLVEAAWRQDSQEDFRGSSQLFQAYNRYLEVVGSFATLGEGINRHMALYYSWRFGAIRRKIAGDKRDADILQMFNEKYSKQEAELSREIDVLARNESLAAGVVESLTKIREEGNSSAVSDEAIDGARRKHQAARDELLKARARRDAIPKMKSFGFTLALYDQQLITDAQAICGKLRQTPRADLAIGNVSGLRPHYKAIVEAYENQFHKRTSGPHEETVGIFFDNYVHDSLAGFGKDATLPSDPRVVYVGGDVKLKFASLKHDAEPAYG